MSEEIVYLDPSEVEIDPYNVRADSPIDDEVIERILEDLKNGKGIEYHITVRVRDGKYYCYVGRNRLLAAKRYVEETGNKIKIPAKIKNVDDYQALKDSLDENVKRRELKPSEVTKAIKRLYSLWVRRKIYESKVIKGEKIDKSKIVDRQQFYKGKVIESEEGEIDVKKLSEDYPIYRFTREVELPVKRTQVIFYLVLDKLPRDIQLMVDRGEIDIYTAYWLAKISDDDTNLSLRMP